MLYTRTNVLPVPVYSRIMVVYYAYFFIVELWYVDTDLKHIILYYNKYVYNTVITIYI